MPPAASASDRRARSATRDLDPPSRIYAGPHEGRMAPTKEFGPCPYTQTTKLVRELVEMLVRNDLAGVNERIDDDVVRLYIGEPSRSAARKP